MDVLLNTETYVCRGFLTLKALVFINNIVASGHKEMENFVSFYRYIPKH